MRDPHFRHARRKMFIECFFHRFPAEGLSSRFFVVVGLKNSSGIAKESETIAATGEKGALFYLHGSFERLFLTVACQSAPRRRRAVSAYAAFDAVYLGSAEGVPHV